MKIYNPISNCQHWIQESVRVFSHEHWLVLHPVKTKFLLFSRWGGGRFFAATITWDRTWLRTLGWSAELLLQQTVCRQLNFNPNLNSKYHISTLKNKLSKSLYALRTVKKTLKPKKPFLLIYNSIFYCPLPVLYAIQIWSCAHSGLINEIFKL